jgi:peroxiredoxin
MERALDGSAVRGHRKELVMRPDIKVGATFPDYELTDHAGKQRRLSALQGDDPMILVLSRGHFCPKDRRQMSNLVEFYPELKVGYTKLVTISTGRSGPSCRTRVARSRRTSTSRSTPTRTTTR